MEIWSESYLQGQLDDAERYLVTKVDYIFFRFSISVEAGRSSYLLPTFVRKILRISYMGYKVFPIGYHEAMELFPATAVVDESTKYEAPQSRPLYYYNDPNDIRGIRFFPTPALTIPANDYDIFGQGADSRVVVSCYRAPLPGSNPLFTLPSYIGRRLKKYFALSMAFEKEGKGQNIKASVYHDKRLEHGVEMFRKINNGVFVSKRPRLDESEAILGYKPHRPVLPPNFSRS